MEGENTPGKGEKERLGLLEGFNQEYLRVCKAREEAEECPSNRSGFCQEYMKLCFHVIHRCYSLKPREPHEMSEGMDPEICPDCNDDCEGCNILKEYKARLEDNTHNEEGAEPEFDLTD